MTKHKLSGYTSMLTRKARRRSLFLFMISAKVRRIRNLTSEPTRGEDGSFVPSELDRGNGTYSGTPCEWHTLKSALQHVFKLLGFDPEIAISVITTQWWRQVQCSNRESILKTSIAFSFPVMESAVSHWTGDRTLQKRISDESQSTARQLGRWTECSLLWQPDSIIWK